MNAPTKIESNRPALITADLLAKDFAHVETAIAALETRGKVAPPVVEDDEDLAVINKLVVELRTAGKRADEVREENKKPYLDAGRIVDGFFKNFSRRIDTLKSGLEQRATRYLQKKADEERRRQAAEEAKLRQEAAQREAAAAEAAKAGDRVGAAVATEEAKTAGNRADDAAAAQAAKPADLARTHTDAGTATLEETWSFQIEAYALINLDALRPYFAAADVEKAIGRYVAINKDTKPLDGVKIIKTSKARMRG